MSMNEEEKTNLIIAIIEALDIATDRLNTHSQDEADQACRDLYDDIFTMIEPIREKMRT